MHDRHDSSSAALKLPRTFPTTLVQILNTIFVIAVLMAWYGVNFVLGKGLHSYGFGLGGETYAVSFFIADLLFVAFATWRYRSTNPPAPPGIAPSRHRRTRRGIA